MRLSNSKISSLFTYIHLKAIAIVNLIKKKPPYENKYQWVATELEKERNVLLDTYINCCLIGLYA